MQLTKNILALAALLPLTLAAPAPEGQLEAKFESGVSILGTAVVTTYSGDACNGNNEQTAVTNGGYRCFAVSNKRSIGYSGSGCTVTTWSGNNCRGSSFVARSSGCYSVLYASVSIQC